MKWAFYIFDPDNLITDDYKKNIWKSAFLYNTNTYPRLLELIQSTYKSFDHFALIYDGNWIFDGPANMAFYTLRYNGGPNKILNHHTASLVDKVMKTEYKRENISDFVEEINDVFNKQFKEN
jgi:hypothetical protein